jgi:predicted permease
VSSLIFSWFLFRNLVGAAKSPPALVAGGLQVSFDLSGRLIQAMAVRRHGCPLMMVMTVLAVALHLDQTLSANTVSCQIFPLQLDGKERRMVECSD